MCPYVLSTLRGTCYILCEIEIDDSNCAINNSLSELVIDGKNGVIFQNAAGLVDQLEVSDISLCLLILK